jgi:hypothetical protein
VHIRAGSPGQRSTRSRPADSFASCRYPHGTTSRGPSSSSSSPWSLPWLAWMQGSSAAAVGKRGSAGFLFYKISNARV